MGAVKRPTSLAGELRIIGFCDYFAGPMVGGSERVTAEVFGRIGTDPNATVTIVSGIVGSAGDPIAIEAVRVITSRGVDLSRILGAQVLFAPLLAVAAVREFRRVRPQVIHGSSIHFFGTVVAAVLALVTRTPFVVTCHLSSVEALARRARVPTRIYERTIGRFVLTRARQIIAVSEAVRDHLVDINVPVEKIVVIENGVDSHRYTPGPDRSTATEPADEPDAPATVGVEVVVVGRLIANKGVIEVAEALDHVRSRVQMTFVGIGPLDARLRDVGADDQRIVVLGHSDDVAAILARTDIFVRYSTTEGRSLAVLEAMSAGCAVIVSDITANTDLVDHRRTGLVVSLGDPKALGAAIDLLAGDPELRNRLGRAARREAQGVGWDDVAARTHKVLLDAADES